MREIIHHFSCLKICQYFQSLNIFVLLTNRYFVSVRKNITEARTFALTEFDRFPIYVLLSGLHQAQARVLENKHVQI